MDTIQHHPNCSPYYPEKIQSEAPQAITEIEIDDGEVALQCVDCGAYVIRKEADKSALITKRRRRRRVK